MIKPISYLVLGGMMWLSGCASTGLSTMAPGADRTAQPDTSPALAVTAPAEVPPVAVAPTPAMPSPALPAAFPKTDLQPLSSQALDTPSVLSLTPPADIWERIRNGFAMPDLDNELVSERERWYQDRPDYVQRMTERGSKYLFHIVEELERRGMPSELALLPFVESAFNPQAVSSAKAAGMWQFMPATGRVFELRQNMFRDDRRDVLASTRAALDYLQKLYGMFGDWHLALAAYNWGEGNVSRAITKAKKAGKGTTYADLKMPPETRLYVPKLQAVKNIVARPERFALTLPAIGNHPYFQSVEIVRDIDVALAARLAEVSLDDFRTLNPSLSRPVLLAAATPQILLPWDNAIIFQTNLNGYDGDRLSSWTAWSVPSTLKPADAARRVGMTEEELRSVNRIQGRMLIKAGSTLLVRRTDRMDRDVSPHVANTAQLKLAPEIRQRKVTVKAGRKDNVASLAKRYRVSAAMVAQWNQLQANAWLKPGQRVVLYLAAKAPHKSRRSSPRKTSSSANATKVAQR